MLAYRATEVPVGDDQRQHIELMRDIARALQRPLRRDASSCPRAGIPEVGARIMNLQDPETRMSTTYGSEQGTVYILDEPDAVRKKVRSAVTDSGTEVRRGADKAGITNLIEILSVVRGAAPEEVEREFEGSGYGDFKAAVAEAVVEYLAPVRERYAELRADEAALEATLAAGAEKARAIASETLADVRERDGHRAAELEPPVPAPSGDLLGSRR